MVLPAYKNLLYFTRMLKAIFKHDQKVLITFRACCSQTGSLQVAYSVFASKFMAMKTFILSVSYCLPYLNIYAVCNPHIF